MKLTALIQPAALHAMATFVSTDETRYALNGVKVEATRKTLQLLATDSHRLCVFSPDDWQHTIDADLAGFIIPRAVLNVLPDKPVRDPWLLSYDSYDGSIALTSKEFSVRTKALDADFPNWKTVIPREIPTTIAIEPCIVNLQFFRDAIDLFLELGEFHGTSAMTCGWKGGFLDPIILKTNRVLIALMTIHDTDKGTSRMKGDT